jgi:hypothetical protein
MNDICHVDLQQLGKIELCLQYGSKGIFCNFSHFVPTFYLNQGYFLKFRALIHHMCTTSAMVPPKSHTNAIPLHVPESTAPTSFVHH